MNKQQTSRPKEEPKFLHVDDWLYNNFRLPDSPEAYAAFVLNWFRTSAGWQAMSRQWMEQFKLFATWKGQRVRVIGASRMGDVWITRDHSKTHGYDNDGRIDIRELSDWGPKP